MKKPCTDCDDGGLLFMLKKRATAEYYTRYVFRCDQCKESKITAYPWGNREVLAMHGYKNIPVTPGAEKITNVSEMLRFFDDSGHVPF